MRPPRPLARPLAALLLLTLAAAALAGAPLRAGEVVVQADAGLIDSGLLRFMAPRFALKHNINVSLQPFDGADEMPDVTPDEETVFLILPPWPPGARPAIEGPAGTYAVLAPDSGPGEKFAAWLRSDTGRRTIGQFTAGDGSKPFAPASPEAAARTRAVFAGDPARGETLAYANCGRCHVIGARNRMKGIGSTPSFAALRALGDWAERFRTFYLRNPHPAVIQIKNVTEPFDITSPSPIRPVELTDAQVEDILSYAAAIEPADLGAPLQSR